MEKTNEVKTNRIGPKQGFAIGILSVVLIGVGVWQWQSLGGSKAVPRPSNPTQTGSMQNGTAYSPSTPLTDGGKPGGAGQMLISTSFAPFPPRDPFRPTIATTTTPTRIAQPAKTGTQRVARQITGTPPVPPLALPAPGGLEVKLAEEPEPPPVPNWTLVGIVQGPRTIAILKDDEGNRRFVRAGDLLEEGWRIQRIERGKLTLQRDGRTISVDVGGSTQTSQMPPSRPTGGISQ